jgi:4-hydroxy-3-polyprenylbenzoate decarboxylase
MPGWYHRPRRLDDIISFIVGRICDQLGIPNALIARWGEGDDPNLRQDANAVSLADLGQSHAETIDGA